MKLSKDPYPRKLKYILNNTYNYFQMNVDALALIHSSVYHEPQTNLLYH